METIYEIFRDLSEKASDIYPTLDRATNRFTSEEAPEPWISFLIGAVFSAVASVMWVHRYKKLAQAIDAPMSFSLRLRACLSAHIDNDEPFYTITKITAQSMLFLGGIQLNYDVAFSAMLCCFALESSFDILRILLAFGEYNDFDDLVVTSESMKRIVKKSATQIKPTNVYEDLSRDKYVVTMVFITQVLLISFVVKDIYDNERTTCIDGTPNCPVGGTLGSWLQYILGIFMQCVFLLGPKTNFGQSEQNPAFWLTLLLYSKQKGTTITWFDPNVDQTFSRDLVARDWRIWIRLLFSFIVNGVGFHILVHALPIQVAAQSSLLGIVFRAVGMIYLVDLDDTSGYTLTLNEADEYKHGEDKPEKTAEKTLVKMTNAEVKLQADQIIAEAREKLDQLTQGKGIASGVGATNALALAAAGGVGATDAINAKKEETPDAEGGGDDEEEGGDTRGDM